MTTFVVTQAAQQLEQKRRELVQQAFIQCGISIRPDGSEDSLIKIKDIPNSAIDYTGWESIDYNVDQLKGELLNEVPEGVDNMEEIILLQETYP
ncbi:hypothetical protein B7463_g10827, partial [Scytalidium lignicola]